ncbi:hypothetical protein JCM10212_001161 [Sporobolomyces blumeae]
MLNGQDVAKHNSADDLWMVIDGKVYDLTDFAPNHPGGTRILLKYAGKDATEEYEPIHPPGTIEEALPPEKHLGPVDPATVERVVERVQPPTNRAASSTNADARGRDESAPDDEPVPTLAACLNLDDLERAAERLLRTKAWAYYRSAADDEYTHAWNRASFARVRLRPRVMRDVSTVDLSTSILGHRSELPFFVAPAAMGRLAHPEGERCLARGAKVHGIPYVVSANASVSFEDLAAQAKDQVLFYQLYVNRDRQKSEDQLRRVVEAGFKGIVVTVDAPVAGKRERDERSKLDEEVVSDPNMRKAVSSTSPDAPDRLQQRPPQGIAQTLGSSSVPSRSSSTLAPRPPGAATTSIATQMFSYVDAALRWTDLAWIKRNAGNLPLVVKGIQSAEDAALAVHYGADAIYLSNHGGRQLEGAPSSLETLLEIRRYEPAVFDRCEVWCDGGVRRGTDVIKLLALGATAVGIGRPFMYSLAFGDDGVVKAATILRDELAQNVRLVGATRISELGPSLVNAKELEENIYDGPYESPVKTLLAKL